MRIAWTILFLVVLANTVLSAHGLTCYHCDGLIGEGACRDGEYGKPGKCPEIQSNTRKVVCSSVKNKDGKTFERGCEPVKLDYVTNGCHPGKRGGEFCDCDTDLCNGPTNPPVAPASSYY